MMAEPAKKEIQKAIQFPRAPVAEPHYTLTEDDLRDLVADVIKATKKKKTKEKPTCSMYTKDGRKKPSPADPIQSNEDFKSIVNYLSKGDDPRISCRNKTIFILGCNIGIRCGDLLRLKIEDVYEEDGTVKAHVELIEQKTRKRNICKIPRMARNALVKYWDVQEFEKADKGAYLFPSKKGGCLNVRSYYHILKDAGEACGLDIDLSTHTMRKTYAVSALKSAKGTDEAGDILMMLQTKFKHSDQRITMHYVKLDQDKLDDMSDRVSDWLGKEE